MGAETMRARQVDELNDLTINFEQANVAFNRYAGIVANALSKTGQTIKKSTFARIRAANDRDAGIRLPASWNVIEKYAGFGGFSHRYRDASQ